MGFMLSLMVGVVVGFPMIIIGAIFLFFGEKIGKL